MNREHTKTLLLVEDEVIIAMMEKMQLEKYGYIVHHVTTGEKAVQTIIDNTQPIDLVLMDINLGSGIDGTQAAEQILNHKDIPVVFLSSHTEPEVVEKTEKITSYGYVVKNSGSVVLDASIKMALKLFNALLETKKKDDALQRSKETAEKYLNVAAEIIISLDINGNITLLNDSGHKLLGWKTGKLIGQNWFDTCLPKENLEEVKKVFSKIMTGNIEPVITYENKVITKSGEIKTVLWHNSILFDTNGKIIGLLSSGEDITEHKLTEMMAVKERTINDTIIESAPGAFYMLDENGRYVRWNAYQRDEIIGKPENMITDIYAIDTIHPDDRDIIGSRIVNVLKNGVAETVEGRVLLRGGPAFKWMLMTGRRIVIEKHSYLLGIAIDITEQIQAKKKRENLDQKYADVVASTSDAVLAVNLDGRITVFNPGAEKLFGYTADAVLGSPITRLSPEDLLEEQAEIIHRVLKTGILTGFESERLTADGRRIPVEITLSRNTDDQGAPLGINAILRDITERKQAEEALRKSEHLTKSIIHFTQDIIVFKDINYIFRLANPAMCKMSGKSENEIIGKTDFDIFPHELAEKYRNDDKYVIESGQSINTEEEVLSYDSIRYMSTTKAPVLNENNACEGVVIIVRDITERKRAKEALKKSETMFRGMFNDHNAVMLLIDPNTGQIVEANQAAAHYYRYPLDNLIQMKIQQLNLLSPSEITEKMSGALNKQVNIFEFQHLLADGQVRDVEVHSTPITIQNQILLFSIIHDITERKQTEDNLKFFKALVESSDQAIAASDMLGNLVYINPAHERLFGYTYEEARKLNYRVFYPPESVDVLDQIVSPALARGENWEGELKVFDRSGREFWLWENAGVIFNSDKMPLYCFGIMDDITERKRVEDMLRESEIRFRVTFEQMAVGIAHVAPDGKWLLINQKLFDIVGYTAVELCSKTFQDITHPEDMYNDIENVKKILSGEIETYSMEKRYFRKDTSIVWVDLTVALVNEADGTPKYFISVVKDISDRKQAEEEIKKQLAEKEILLREVHHRVKNNIANIEGLLSLQADSSANPEVKTALQDAISRVQSMRILYDKLLMTKDYHEISIQSYTENLIDSLLAVFVVNNNITIEKYILDFNIISKKAISIGIIINELLTNVFKYAFKDRDKGTVSVSIEKMENMVTVIIQDNGIGIDERILENKSPGFGLTIVKMLVEQLEGTYSFVNENGTRSVIQFKI